MKMSFRGSRQRLLLSLEKTPKPLTWLLASLNQELLHDNSRMEQHLRLGKSDLRVKLLKERRLLDKKS